MNGPNDLDDGWAELARELGLEGDRPTHAPPAADRHPPEVPTAEGDDDQFVELPGEAPTEADVYAEADADADTESDDGESDDGDADGDSDGGEEAEGDGEGETTGEPGEPKKKRRRRRRRKKGPGDVAAAPVAEGESADDSDESTEADDSDDAPTDDNLVEEEGATPAATRELIANWDVPSWETIVTTMLFRPHGR